MDLTVVGIVIWIWLSYGYDRLMELTSCGSDHYMDLTILWNWPSCGSYCHMNLTVLWNWRHMDLIVIWIWPPLGSDRHMDLTVTWNWPSFGSDRHMNLTVLNIHMNLTTPMEDSNNHSPWPPYLSIILIKPNAYLRTSYDFLLEVGENSNIHNINRLVLSLSIYMFSRVPLWNVIKR